MTSQNKGQKKIQALVCTPPMAGHYIPIIPIVQRLSKQKDFQVTFATSYYIQQKIKFQVDNIKRMDLKDEVKTISLNKKDKMPFMQFQEVWRLQLEEYVKNYNPNILICDLFATALIKIGHKYNITTVIISPSPIQDQIIIFDFPVLNKNISFFGVTVLYNNLIQPILPKKVRQMHDLGIYIDKSLVLVPSANGLSNAISLPPNIRLIGTTKIPKIKEPVFQEELSLWIQKAKSMKKDIIYITFGSIVELSQKFIDFLYQGLKKIDIAVIWSLRKGKIPQQDERFFVRQWLPQEDILKLPQVKIVLTHCGWGAVIECIQARKPMLCVPTFADQPRNALLIQKRGLGVILRKGSRRLVLPSQLIQPKFTHQQLSTKINLLRTQPRFIQNFQKINRLLDEAGGVQQAVRLIKNAAKNGIDHLIDKNIDKIRRRSILPLLLLIIVVIVGLLCYKMGIFNSQIKGEL